MSFSGVSPKKMVKMEVSEKIVAEQEKQPEIEEQDMLGSETQEQEQAGYHNMNLLNQNTLRKAIHVQQNCTCPTVILQNCACVKQVLIG